MNDNKAVLLDDSALDQVYGGGWFDSKFTYSSGDTPRYSAGQTVRYLYIVSVNSEKQGYINKEFTYVVAHSYDHADIVDSNMYESEIMRAEQGRSASSTRIG